MKVTYVGCAMYDGDILITCSDSSYHRPVNG